MILSDKVAAIDKSSAKSGCISGLASVNVHEVKSGGLDLHTNQMSSADVQRMTIDGTGSQKP